MQLKLLLNCCKFTFFVGLELCNICLYIQVDCSFWVTFLCSKIFLFQSRFSFTDTGNSQDSRGREGTIFYSTLPIPPAHEHSDIYLQLCTWDGYHIFLIVTLAFTKLLLDEIYHMLKLLFDSFMDVILVFVYLLKWF